MARTCWLTIALLAITGLSHAGELKGASEVSTSMQFGQVNSSYEYTYHSGPNAYTQTSDSKHSFLTLTMRYGKFVASGLEISPELQWTAIEEWEPAFSIAANLEYNFAPLSTSEKQRNVPFLLAGYGIGNAAPAYMWFVSRTSDKFDVPVLNLGAGLKTFVSDRVALRFEYRYQRFSWDESYQSAFSSSTSKYVDQYHRFLFGFSVFFPQHSTGAASSGEQDCGGCGM